MPAQVSEGAHDELIALAELIEAPIGHSLRGKDFVQYDNPYDIGMTGLLGYGAAAEGIEDADLLILLGTDFPYDQFLPGTRTAQVDRAAHGWAGGPTSTSPSMATSCQRSTALMPLLTPKKSRRFLDQMLKKHDRLMNKAVGAYTRKVEKNQPIHPEYAASLLDQVAAEDAIFTADTGMCNVWTARYINPLGTRRLIGSYLHGSMANALPHAIGAQLAYPGRQVISVSGRRRAVHAAGRADHRGRAPAAGERGGLQQLHPGHGQAGDAGGRAP